MYTPAHFSANDKDLQIRKLIEQNGFATLLSFPDNAPVFINHLPIIFSSTPGYEKIIIGHMAKRNPQWMHFKKNPNATLIIQGPHTYITPTWYKSGRDVPTWNYAVAHLHGKIQLVENFTDQVEILKQLTKFYEAPSPSPWEFELPEDLLDESALTSAIISFQFHTEKIEAKFKLSQNRPAEDRQGVMDGLSARTDDQSLAIRRLMQESKT